jgi:hypothetical protein
MRANNLSSQSGTFRRRLNDDQGRGEPTKKKPPRFLTRPIKAVLLLGIGNWEFGHGYTPVQPGEIGTIWVRALLGPGTRVYTCWTGVMLCTEN